MRSRGYREVSKPFILNVLLATEMVSAECFLLGTHRRVAWFLFVQEDYTK